MTVASGKKAKTPSRIPIKQGLLGGIVILVLMLAIGIFAATYFNARSVEAKLSGEIIRHSLETVHSQLQRFFAPVETSLVLLRQWAQTGIIHTDQADRNLNLVQPVLSAHSHISSILIADNRGHEHMILHHDGGWLSRQTKRDAWGELALHSQWGPNRPKTQEWKNPGYNPKERPWYKGAMDVYQSTGTTTLFWTEPYIFFTTKDPGITASVAFGCRPYLCVLGVDVLLKEITRFSSNMDVTPNGMIFILTEDRRVVGLPAGLNKKRYQSDLLKKPEQLGIAAVADATRSFDQLTQGYQGPFNFQSNNNRWWGGIKPFALSPDKQLWIAVVLPESDLIQDVTRLRLWLGVVLLMVFILAILAAFSLAKRYSSPLEQLAHQSARISMGDFNHPVQTQSRLLEIDLLARAYESMRQNLQSLFKLERDLQLAKQIQANTIPANIPRLPRFDVGGWSQPAEQTAGDSYDIIGCGHHDRRRVLLDESAEPADELIMFLADATGHGIGPALSVTQVRSMLRMAVRMDGDMPQIIAHMNDQLLNDLHGGRFVTMWLGKLDRSGILTSLSAGQAPLLYYQHDADTIRVLDANAPPLGVVDHFRLAHVNPITLQPGDIFVVLSDGVFEHSRPDRETFGMNRIQDWLRSCRDLSVEHMLAELQIRLDRFASSHHLKDDQTAIIIKCTA